MSEGKQVRIDPGFALRIPDGWVAEPDEEEGVSVYAEEGIGLLHLVSFEQPAGLELDPGEELYSFLEDQGVELEDDEVEDVALGDAAGMALCEYLSEDEEEETYWLVAVATAPGILVLASYTCPAGEEGAEREKVVGTLRSLELTPA